FIGVVRLRQGLSNTGADLNGSLTARKHFGGMRMNRSTLVGAAAVLTCCVALVSLTVMPIPGNALFKLKSARDDYRRPDAIPYPDDNPYSPAKQTLGEMLFFDAKLSGSNVRSCSSCHEPSLSWGDGRSRAVGENRTVLPLRTPTLLNVAWVPRP